MAKNTEELRNVCVSDGTMRTEDLFPKMYWILKEYAPEKAKEFAEFAEDDSWMGGEEDGLIMDELFNALNEIAPEGCVFGSQEGDGACYGFWEMEEESYKRRGRMLKESRIAHRFPLNEGVRTITQRFARSLIGDPYIEAKDISEYSHEECKKLQEEEGYLEKIGMGYGIYGMNCGWFKGHNTGTDYVIIGRWPSLFFFGY